MTVRKNPQPRAAGLDLDLATRAFLTALASETRQRLLVLFADGGELTVGEVAARGGIGQSTASEQLALLRAGGLLQSTRDGKLVRYRANRDGIANQLAELQDYLSRCCPPTSPVAVRTTLNPTDGVSTR